MAPSSAKNRTAQIGFSAWNISGRSRMLMTPRKVNVAK